jgi:hypothetical protein
VPTPSVLLSSDIPTVLRKRRRMKTMTRRRMTIMVRSRVKIVKILRI